MFRKKFLVPVNFSRPSDAALHYAMKMASAMKGMISCIHVNEEPDCITGKFLTKEVNDRIRRLSEEMLSAKANEILNKENKIPFEIIVTAGKVHRKIREKAGDLNADFIVMGKSDSADPESGGLGSNTNRVIAKSNIPVLMVSNTRYIGSDLIILPLDLSKPVERKIMKAMEIAKTLNANIYILSVLGSDWIGLKNSYLERLEEIGRFFRNDGIPCETRLKISEESVSDAILAFSKGKKAGMILLMTQQEKKYVDQFIGSTIQEILNKSEIPVLSMIPEVDTKNANISFLPGNIANPIQLL